MLTFVSQAYYGKKLPDFSEAIIRDEPNFMDASIDFAYEHGGPITKRFIEVSRSEPGLGSLPPLIIDVRVHRLEPGWLPAIPGWHHEDASRVGNVNRYPNYTNPAYRSFHCMAMANGKICPTEFAFGTGNFELPPVDHPPYVKWGEEVDSYIENKRFRLAQAPSNQLIWFNDRAWHRAAPATESGWRWWGRISYFTQRKVTNKIIEQYPHYVKQKNGLLLPGCA